MTWSDELPSRSTPSVGAELALIMDAARTEFLTQVSAAVSPIQRCLAELDARLGKLEAEQLAPRIVVLEGEVQRISTLATCILEEVTSRKFSEHASLLKQSGPCEEEVSLPEVRPEPVWKAPDVQVPSAQELEAEREARAASLAEAEMLLGATPASSPATSSPSLQLLLSPKPGSRPLGASSPRGPVAPPASPAPQEAETTPASKMERKRSHSTLSPLQEDQQENCLNARNGFSCAREPQESEPEPSTETLLLDRTQATVGPEGYECAGLHASISSIASDTTAAPDSVTPLQWRRDPGDTSTASRTYQSSSEASLHLPDSGLHLPECTPAASAPAPPPASVSPVQPCGGSAASAVGPRPVSPLSHRWMTPQGKAGYQLPSSPSASLTTHQVSSARQERPASSRSTTQSRTSPSREGPVSSRSTAPSRSSPARDRLSQCQAPQSAGRSPTPRVLTSPQPASRSMQAHSTHPIVHIATARSEGGSCWTSVGTTTTVHGERERFLSELSALREENKSLREVKQQQQLLGAKVETAKPQRQTSCPVAGVAGVAPAPMQQIRSLVQTTTGPQAVWTSCGAVTPMTPGVPWQTQGVRQATTPVRQASSPLRQRNL